MDVAQGEGRGAAGVELDAVVLIGGVRSSERARSLGAAFTVANQYLKQFTPAMQSSEETNTRSKTYFGLGGTDAATIAKHTTGLDAQDLLLLPRYHAYANVMQHGQATE